MSNLYVVPKWVQRTRVMSSWATCKGEWPSDFRPLNYPARNSYLEGESFTRDEKAPYKGNHIDALPYHSEKTTVHAPAWDAKCIQKRGGMGCDAYEYKGSGLTFTSILPADFVIPSGTFTKEEKEFCQRFALMKAQAALRSADASIPMMLKERAETVKMMKSYAGRGLDLIRRRQLADVKRWKSLKRVPREQKKFLAQTIANEHLMFIFGMLPLLEDLEGLAKHVTRDEYKFIKGRGRQTKKVNVVKTTAHPYAFHTVHKTDYVYSVRVNLRADITFKIGARMQQLGFNPLYTVYDFTPLSFITGWFSNFNHWLKSLDPLYGSKYRTGSYSIREGSIVEKTTHGWGTDILTPTGNGYSLGTSNKDLRLPIPSEPPTVSPEFYNNFSFYSVAAGASLFVQRKVKLAQRAIGMKPFRYRSKKPAYLPPITYKKV